MPLHIPRGLLLTGDAANPFTLAAALRPVLLEVADDLWHTLLAQRVTDYLDRVRAGQEVDDKIEAAVARRPEWVLASVASAVREQVIAAGTDVWRHPETDLSCQVKVLAHPDRQDALLGIIFAEQSAYRDAIEALAGVADYGYWSCETPPVAPDAWELRERVWSSALRGGMWSDLGWTWSVLGDFPVRTLPSLGRPNVDKVLARIPSLDDRERALSLAMVRLDQDFFDAHRNDISAILDTTNAQARTHAPAARSVLRAITEADLVG